MLVEGFTVVGDTKVECLATLLLPLFGKKFVLHIREGHVLSWTFKKWVYHVDSMGNRKQCFHNSSLITNQHRLGANSRYPKLPAILCFVRFPLIYLCGDGSVCAFISLADFSDCQTRVQKI